jgi:hypothetical protein
MLKPGEAKPSRQTIPTALAPIAAPMAERIKRLESLRPRTYSWLAMRTLLESRNWAMTELIAGANTDIVNDERERWIAAVRAAGLLEKFPDFIVKPELTGDVSFLVVGDPGEADLSQYVTVPAIEAHGSETDFMVVLSDVIYPTGETNDYVAAFYEPYREYRRPIYALPGNHDWYALLTGFMWHFCEIEALPETAVRLTSYTWQERLARFLWLRPTTPNRPRLRSYRDERTKRLNEALGLDPRLPFTPYQPGPYFAIDTDYVRLVCIDTGTSGTIDREQGNWVCRVSARADGDDRPRILLTGKPIYVNGTYKPTTITWRPQEEPQPEPEPEGLRKRLVSWRLSAAEPKPTDTDQPFHFKTVDDVVCDPAHDYIAAIGGDVHNYQRYPVRLVDDGREIQYIVSGGGGAFMSPTHLIEAIDESELVRVPPREDPCSAAAKARAKRVPMTEDDLRLFPLRGDSLARYTKGSGRQLRKLIAASLLISLIFLALSGWLSEGRLPSWWTTKVLVVEGAVLLLVLIRYRRESIAWRLENLSISGGNAISLAAGLGMLATILGLGYIGFIAGRSLPDPPPDVGKGATIVIAGILLASGAGVLLLRWFRFRLRVVLAALSAGMAAYLLGFAGDWELLAVPVATLVIVFVASLRTLRGLRLTARLGVALLAGLALGVALLLGWPAAVVAGLALGVPGALILGGPRYSHRTVVLMGVALLIASQVLWAISNGHAWIPLAALSFAAALPGLYLLYIAWSLLPDQPVPRNVAAKYVAERLKTKPERPAARCETIGSWPDRKLNALLPPNPTARILYGGETVYSAIFDFNDAPFYKSFLRIEVSQENLTISCFGVTKANDVKLEDELRWHRKRGWTKTRARLVDPTSRESFGSADVFVEGTTSKIAFDLGTRVNSGTKTRAQLKGEAGTCVLVKFEYTPDELVPIAGAAGNTRLRELVVSTDAGVIARGDFL